ncbi:MAG: Protease HtpX [Fimbriimonadaceae bacterium]|nr:Protease HtpX [Fimbriimonadaceae bacterium]
MDQQQYDELVRSNQELAKSDFAAYERKVGRFRAIGRLAFVGLFVGVLLVLGLLVALMIFMGSGALAKFAIFAGIAAVFFIRAMIFRVPPPENRATSPQESPALFADIERARQTLAAPQVDGVQIMGDSNAFAAKSTKLGPFGSAYYVCLGLPLLLRMSRDEVLSIIAHELGHHSRKHTHRTMKAWQDQLMWSKLLEKFNHENSVVAGIARRFLDWYVPRLEALLSVVRRQSEFEADACAAEVTSPEIAAKALLKISVLDSALLGPYERRVWNRAVEDPQPARDYFTQMVELELADDARLRDALESQSKLTTTIDDSHPSLMDRITALGQGHLLNAENRESLIADLQKNPCPSALMAYFEGRSEKLLSDFDHEWSTMVAHEWKSSYDDAAALKQESARIITIPASDRTVKDWMELARFNGIHNSDAAALEVMQEAVQYLPSDPAILRYLGRAQYLTGSDEAAATLERALEIAESDEQRYTLRRELAGIYYKQGNAERAREINLQADEIAEKENEILAELYSVFPGDDLRPTQLDEREFAVIDKLVGGVSQIQSVHAFEKFSTKHVGRSARLVVFTVRWNAFALSEDQIAEAARKAIEEAMAEKLDIDWAAVTPSNDLAKYLKKKRKDLLYWSR